ELHGPLRAVPRRLRALPRPVAALRGPGPGRRRHALCGAGSEPLGPRAARHDAAAAQLQGHTALRLALLRGALASGGAAPDGRLLGRQRCASDERPCAAGADELLVSRARLARGPQLPRAGAGWTARSSHANPRPTPAGPRPRRLPLQRAVARVWCRLAAPEAPPAAPPGTLPRSRLREVEAVVQQAEEDLRAWGAAAGKGGRQRPYFFELLVTAWPVWQALHRVGLQLLAFFALACEGTAAVPEALLAAAGSASAARRRLAAPD
ncbi:unnamed protein product, partial [Prorocentrum cordatum]